MRVGLKPTLTVHVPDGTAGHLRDLLRPDERLRVSGGTASLRLSAHDHRWLRWEPDEG